MKTNLAKTVEEVAHLGRLYPGRGWTATWCGACRKTANVQAGGPGWFCECGEHHLLTEDSIKPHDRPDMGPPLAVIDAGYAAAAAGGISSSAPGGSSPISTS